jgi:hypothetical protein
MSFLNAFQAATCEHSTCIGMRLPPVGILYSATASLRVSGIE